MSSPRYLPDEETPETALVDELLGRLKATGLGAYTGIQDILGDFAGSREGVVPENIVSESRAEYPLNYTLGSIIPSILSFGIAPSGMSSGIKPIPPVQQSTAMMRAPRPLANIQTPEVEVLKSEMYGIPRIAMEHERPPLGTTEVIEGTSGHQGLQIPDNIVGVAGPRSLAGKAPGAAVRRAYTYWDRKNPLIQEARASRPEKINLEQMNTNPLATKMQLRENALARRADEIRYNLTTEDPSMTPEEIEHVVDTLMPGERAMRKFWDPEEQMSENLRKAVSEPHVIEARRGEKYRRD